MAVRHGYGKVATNGLVFAYDTGDTVNSYKGEPTTNTVQAFPVTAATTGVGWGAYEYSVEVVDAPIGGHPLSDKKWMKFTKTSNTNGRVGFLSNSFTSGSTYTWSCYAYINDDNNTRLVHNSDNTAYSQRVSFNQYDLSKIGTVQRLYGTWNQLQNGSSIFGMRGGSTDPIGTVLYMTGIQVEEKAHPTQLTEGTRSNTEGLLDLTGLGGLDLSNVSFDSNAQMTFDGTDDRIELEDTFDLADHFVDNQSFTIEVVVNILSSTAAGNGYAGIFTNQKYQTESDPGGFGLAISTSGGLHFRLMMTDSTPTSYQGNAIMSINVGQMEHITYTYDSAADTVTAYRNGESTSTTVSSTIQWSVPTDSTRTAIGRNTQGGWGSYYNSDLPVVKCYNRALTADEVRNNYRHYKNRFNI